MQKILIGVMGPGDRARLEDEQLAEELGKGIASEGWVLLSGGRNVGVMNAVNKGAKQAGGLTIGILPGADASGASEFVDIGIISGMGSARNNMNVLSCSVVVACGEVGAGSMSEVALALKAKKPVVLLGVQSEIVQATKTIGGDLVTACSSVDDAIQKIRQLVG